MVLKPVGLVPSEAVFNMTMLLLYDKCKKIVFPVCWLISASKILSTILKDDLWSIKIYGAVKPIEWDMDSTLI